MYKRLVITEALLFLLAAGSLIFRLFYVSHFNFAFTIDQAHDILEIRRLAVAHDLVLVGPSTSLNGIFYGPFWFYYNLPAFFIGGGDPTALVYGEIIFYFAVILLLYLIFRKKSFLFAVLSVAFILLSPRLLMATSYALNSNTSPAFVLLFIILLSQFSPKSRRPAVFGLGVLAGLGLQIEVFCLLLLPLGLFWLNRRQIKQIFVYFFGFLVTLLPQLIYEAAHRFPMTRTFLAEFTGAGHILGDKIGLFAKFYDRYLHYLNELQGSFPLGQLGVAVFIIVVFLYLQQRKNRKTAVDTVFDISSFLLIFSVIFFLIYPNRLKDWMTINFVIPYILIFSVCLASLFDSRKPILRLAVLLIFAGSLLSGASLYRDKLVEKLGPKSNDPGSLANQIEAVDWVYQKAGGLGFVVYDYAPAIYDYNYQYLFWWYGAKKYGYQPAKITYQDDVPEYIKNNIRYWTMKRQPTNTGLTFLIVEPDKNNEIRQSAWLDHFGSLCVDQKKLFDSQILVQLRRPCSSSYE